MEKLIKIVQNLLSVIYFFLLVAGFCAAGYLVASWSSDLETWLVIAIVSAIIFIVAFALKRIRSGEIDFGAIIIALCLSLFTMVYVTEMVGNLDQPNYELQPNFASSFSIVAIGEKNENAKSSEVWFQGARLADGTVVPWDKFHLDPAWEQRGEQFVSYLNQPNLATLQGRFKQPIDLIFSSHPWSGKVLINDGRDDHTYDLYDPDSKEVVLRFHAWPYGNSAGYRYNLSLIVLASLPFTILACFFGRISRYLISMFDMRIPIKIFLGFLSVSFSILSLAGLCAAIYIAASWFTYLEAWLALALGSAIIFTASFVIKRLRSGIPDLRVIILTLCMASVAMVCMSKMFWYLERPNYVLPSDFTSTYSIVAIGEKNQTAKSSEVYLRGARLADGTVVPWDKFHLDAAWEQRGEQFISNLNQPSLATLQGRFEQPIDLIFGSHPWSGKVLINDGRDDHIYDLYDPESKEVKIRFNKWPSSNSAGKLYYVSLIALSSLPFTILAYFSLRISVSLFTISPLLLIAAASAPGLYSPDSIAQLQQALVGQYDDWHPPIMAALWRSLIPIFGSAAGLFWFNVSLFLFAISAFIIVLTRSASLHPIGLVVLFVAAPSIYLFIPLIWKDVLMAGSMFSAFGVIALRTLDRLRYSWGLPLLILLLFIVLGARQNAIFAVFPIFVPLFLENTNNSIWRILVATAASIACAGMIFYLVDKVNYVYLGADKHYPIQYIMLHDLGCIVSYGGNAKIPDVFLSPDYSDENVKASCRADHGNDMVFEGVHKPPFLLSFKPESQVELRKAWVNAIEENFSIYIKHRLNVFLSLLRIGDISPYGVVVDLPGSEKLILQVTAPIGERFFSAGVYGVFVDFIVFFSAYTPIFLGWFALLMLLSNAVISMLFLPLGRVMRYVLALSASGLLYLLPYLFVAPASDFRYLYWSNIAAWVGSALIVSSLVKRWVDGRRSASIVS